MILMYSEIQTLRLFNEWEIRHFCIHLCSNISLLQLYGNAINYTKRGKHAKSINCQILSHYFFIQYVLIKTKWNSCNSPNKKPLFMACLLIKYVLAMCYHFSQKCSCKEKLNIAKIFVHFIMLCNAPILQYVVVASGHQRDGAGQRQALLLER